MTVTLMRLVDGDREFVVHRLPDYRDDVIVANLDVPMPAVRAVTAPRTDDDGEIDTTAHHGGRAVSLGLTLLDTPAALVDELNRFLHPRARPWLHVVDDEWPGERRLRLRVDQFAAPIPAGRLSRAAQLQWQAPDGVWEATDAITLIVAADAGTLAGRTYPEAWPRAFPSTQGAGQLLHVSPGGTWQHYTGRLYGPCRGPRLTEDTTGATIAFTEDLVIPSGEYVEINTRDRTAFYMSDPSLTRLNMIDFEATTWWRIAPGVNQIRYHPAGGVEIGCAAELEYHPNWL